MECVFKREQNITSASRDHFFLPIQDLSRMAVWVGGGTEILYNDFCSLVVFWYYRIFAPADQLQEFWASLIEQKGGYNFFFDKNLGGHGFSTTCTQKLSYKALIHSIQSCRSEPNHFSLALMYCHSLLFLKFLLLNQMTSLNKSTKVTVRKDNWQNHGAGGNSYIELEWCDSFLLL